MPTARRYLAREIYRSSAVVLMALIGLFTFFALIEELDSVGTKFTLLNLFYMQALALPTRLYDLLPIGLLIGAILALAGLAQRNELVILRVSGVSGMKLLAMLWVVRSEEHTSELQSLMRISYAVFCLKKKNHTSDTTQ